MIICVSYLVKQLFAWNIKLRTSIFDLWSDDVTLALRLHGIELNHTFLVKGKDHYLQNRYAVTSLFLIWKYRTHFICHLRKILQNFMKNFWRYAGFSKILHWLQWTKSNFSKPCDSQEVLERGHNTFFMNFSRYQKYLQQITRTFMKNFGIWLHSDFSP